MVADAAVSTIDRRERHVSLGDFTTRAVSQGHGDGVLLIAGAGASAASWQGVVLLLSRDWTVWTYDQRGVGAAVDAPGQVDAIALTADATRLLDVLGLARVHLVGHSTGARTAIALAQAMPKRIRSVTALCTWGWPDPFLEHRFALVRDIVRHMPFAAARQALGYFLASRPWQHDELRFSRLLIGLGRDPHDPAWRALARHLLAPTTGDPVREALPAVPALVMAAPDDRMIPPDYARDLAQAWAHARFAWLGGETASHLVHIEQPAATARAVAEFLASNRD